MTNHSGRRDDEFEDDIEEMVMRMPDNPALPKDLGLSSLGLLMQIVAGLFLLFEVAFLGASLFGLAGAAGGTTFMVFLIGLSAVVRTVFHLLAGLKLSQGAMDGRNAAVNYAWVGIAQTVLVTGILFLLADLPISAVLVSLLMQGFWPVIVLLLVHRREVREQYRYAVENFEHLIGRDLGLEGAGILMTAFGCIGLPFSLLIILGMVSADASMLLFLGGHGRVGFAMVVFLIGLGLLALRSILHLVAGVSALKGARPWRVKALVGRYVWVAHIANLTLVVAIVSAIGFNLGSMLFIAIFIGALALWPSMIRNFSNRVLIHGEVSLDAMVDVFDDGEVDPNTMNRARDGGLTAIGYLLLMYYSFLLVLGLVQIMGGSPMQLMGGGLFAGEAVAESGMVGWLEPLLAAIAVWAGVELVMMSSRYRIAGYAFGGAWTLYGLSNLYQTWTALDMMMVSGGPAILGTLGEAAIGLSVPILTLILVNRRLPSKAPALV